MEHAGFCRIPKKLFSKVINPVSVQKKTEIPMVGILKNYAGDAQYEFSKEIAVQRRSDLSFRRNELRGIVPN